MKVTTLRLPESMYEALEAEAEAEEKSLSEYVREILRNRENTQPNTQEHTQPNTSEYDERIRDLEQRVGDLEEWVSAQGEPVTDERRPDRRPEPAESPSGQEAPSDDVRAVVEEIADREGWPDDGRREARITAAVAAVETAQERGSLGKSEAVDELGLAEEYPVSGQDGETWWRKNVRPVLRAIGDYDSGAHGYRVDLGERGGGSVYGPTDEF